MNITFVRRFLQLLRRNKYFVTRTHCTVDNNIYALQNES